MNLRRIPLPILGVLAAATVVVAAAIALAPAVRPVPVAILPSASATAPLTTTPVPTPTAVPVLRVDGMATVAAAGGLQVWSAPGGAKAKAEKPLLAAGTVVYLAGGPRHSGRIDWWEVEGDDAPGHAFLFGWVHGTGSSGEPSLVPLTPDCPTTGPVVDTNDLQGLRPLRTLACFGPRELAMRGLLSCTDAAIDAAVSGPSWLSNNVLCDLDGVVGLHGSKVTSLIAGIAGPLHARFEIRGHVDDPEAATCGWIPFGLSVSGPVGPPDPGAVLVCRQLFVVTAATALP